MNKLAAIALVLASVGFVSEARASEPRTHDGFHLSLGAGVGYYQSKAERGGVSQKIKGVTVPTSLLLGGSVIPGLVLGGGFTMDVAPSPSFGGVSGVDAKQYLIGFIGGYVDYYIWPEDGLHFQYFIGYGGLETSSNGSAGGSDPTGVVMHFGAGYDFFVADEVSVGVLAKMGYAPLKLNGTKYKTIAPGLALTLTYH